MSGFRLEKLIIILTFNDMYMQVGFIQFIFEPKVESTQGTILVTGGVARLLMSW